MNYTVIGTPQVQAEYSDAWETTMVIGLHREDGVTGDVWIVAGVPDSQRDDSAKVGSQRGYQSVRVFGDAPDTWCPPSFDYADAGAIVVACKAVALAAHQGR